jgi:hypothetical protein
MKTLIFGLLVSLCLFGQEIAGKWQLSMETPHGMVKGDLQLKQDGSKLSGTYVVEHMGTLALTGSVDGQKVSFSMDVPNSDQTFGFSGTLDGEKMSGTTAQGGTWSAAR